MYNLSIFSERLKEIMFDRNDMKSEALAKEIGTAGSTVRTWLNATNEISLENAIKIADFFHCSLDYLAGKTETDQEIIPHSLPPFYDNLRLVMKQTGKTRYRITKETAIKDAFFTNWRKGQMPMLSSVCELADYMHVTLDYLTGRET